MGGVAKREEKSEGSLGETVGDERLRGGFVVEVRMI